MELAFKSARSPLCGTLTVPGDKSLAHRAVLFGALAEGRSAVTRYPDSGVTRAMRGALAALGVPSTLEDGLLTVEGRGWRPFPNAGARAFCGNSATTIRLLAGALAGTGGAAVLDGSEGLRHRPMDRIVEPLRLMGADVEATDGHAPLVFRARRASARADASPEPFSYALGVASAQVLSCLQLAALGGRAEAHFSVPGPVRDHTVRLLAAMGAEIDETRVRPLRRPLAPLVGELAGDVSSAAFLFAAAAIVPGSRVTVRGVGVNPGRTGFLDVLERMGLAVEYAARRESLGEPIADVTVEAVRPLCAAVVDGDDVVRAIDEFPALAAVAAFAQGVTVVRGAKELRYKETDRIAAICRLFGALGAEVEEFADGFALKGGTLRGGRAAAGGDHRLAMALALAGLRAPVTVEGAEILTESYPEFACALAGLGARRRG